MINSARPFESRSSSGGRGLYRKDVTGAHSPFLIRTNATAEIIKTKLNLDIARLSEKPGTLTSVERSGE
jgi:hypothetical protein